MDGLEQAMGSGIFGGETAVSNLMSHLALFTVVPGCFCRFGVVWVVEDVALFGVADGVGFREVGCGGEGDGGRVGIEFDFVVGANPT